MAACFRRLRSTITDCVFLSALVSLSSSNKPTQIELAVDQQLANASDGKVNLSLIVLIYDVSEPRVLQMEVDVDLSVVMEANFASGQRCRDLRRIPLVYNVNAPRPGHPAYVPPNPPVGGKIKENLWFPVLFYDEASKVWCPSSTMDTSSAMYTSLVPVDQADRSFHCTAVYFTRRRITVGCSFEFRDYPLDSQRCFLTLATFSYYLNTEMSMRWKSSGTEGLRPDPSIVISEYSLRISNATSAHSEVAILFEFSRKLFSQLVCTILPSFFLVEVSFGVYLMPPELITERIALSVNALLVLFNTFIGTRTFVPPSGSMTYMDIWTSVCLLTVLLVMVECCLVEQLSTSEIEFEERRTRRETDLRNKDDLYRYVQRFKVQTRLEQKFIEEENYVFQDKMPRRSRAASFGPAVVSPGPGYIRPPSEILTGKRRRRISHDDLDRAVKGLIWYIDKVTPWYRLPWTAKSVDLWAKRSLVGAFNTFAVVFWVYVKIIK